MITNEIPGKQSVAESFSQGQVLADNFTLKQKLSTADTGDLWLAHDAESDGEIALLFLPGAVAKDVRAMEELRAQVKLNRQLIHPHVLRTHDFIEEGEWAAISSDAVEAHSLASLLAKEEKGVFNPSAIQPWLATICQTLDDAHRAGLLHRDLVPRNILLAPGGGVLIANFGISRIILDSLARSLGAGKIDEHLASMSPQQLDGELPARWDDIYALGALIYQLLTGKPAFDGGDLLPQIRKSVPPPIGERRAQLGIDGEPVPDAWEKVVAACLEKHTPQRPKSAREVGVKLGAQITLVAPAQMTKIVVPDPVPGETATPEPKPAVEIQKAPAQAPVKSTPPVESKEIPKDDAEGESKESLIEDIVWRKPAQQTPVAPGQAPSFKHLLEKIPEEQGAKKGAPLLKLAVVIAGAAAIVWLIIHLSSGKPETKPAPPIASATPAAGASVAPKATPQIASAQPSASPATPGKLTPLDQARKNLQDLQAIVEAKTKARQQAEAEATAAKAAVDAESPALDAIKKTADDAAAQAKQRADDEAKATADAAKAADDLKAAQKAADEKAALLAAATKAKEQALAQSKDQETARNNETAKVEDLQKTATEKQADADAAGNAEKDAMTQLDALKAQVTQMETEVAQAATPAPSPANGGPAAIPSATPDSFVPITPASTPAESGSIEAEEQMVLNNIREHDSGTQAAATPAPVATPSVASTYVPNPNSQIDHTLTNSLGMKFQPVDDVLFCIWLTRVQDFEVFAKETRFKSTSWLAPGFKQEDTCPVVYVSWNDATAFCKWLTDKEHKSGVLAPNQIYRLPTDLEWSKAVGLPEEAGRTPDDRDVGIKGVYPWGTQWPPPPGAGNYDGEETDSEVSIKGYNDGYVYTSPVGSFAANKYGLYDMGGNAWEWCMDWYNGEQKQKVLRGASWYNGDLQLSLLSSCRWPAPPDKVSDDFGFRVVVATEGKSRK